MSVYGPPRTALSLFEIEERVGEQDQTQEQNIA